MIEIASTTAIMLYLSATLLTLLGLWLRDHSRSRHKKISIAEKELFVCEYCHFAYLAEHVKLVTRCPQCLSYNKDNTHSKFKKK